MGVLPTLIQLISAQLGRFLSLDGHDLAVHSVAAADATTRVIIEAQGDGNVAIRPEASPNVFLHIDRASSSGPGAVSLQSGVGPNAKLRLIARADGTVLVASSSFTDVFLHLDETQVSSKLDVGQLERFRIDVVQN